MSEENQEQNQIETQEAPENQAVEQENASFEEEVNKIFGQTAEDPFAANEEGSQQSTQETSADEGPQEEQSSEGDSAKYWQSEADKRQANVDEVMNALGVDNIGELSRTANEMKTLMPIARYINDNPNVLNAVENSLSTGETPGQAPPQGNQEKLVKKPERPTKPGNYDPVEAVSDPESESFKFREKLDGYRDDMIGYYEQVSEQQQNYQAQLQAQQQQQSNLVQLRDRLQNQHKFSDAEADQFITFMSSPESTSEESLVDYYRYRFEHKQKMEQADDNQNRNKIDEMKREKERLSIKSPVAVTPGNESQTEKPIEDQLMDRMVAQHNRQNPW